MWYIYTTKCYSAVKNNDIVKFEDKWMELEKIFLIEVTQTQKDKHGQAHLPGDGVADSGPDPPPSNVSQDNLSQTWPQTNLMKLHRLGGSGGDAVTLELFTGLGSGTLSSRRLKVCPSNVSVKLSCSGMPGKRQAGMRRQRAKMFFGWPFTLQKNVGHLDSGSVSEIEDEDGEYQRKGRNRSCFQKVPLRRQKWNHLDTKCVQKVLGNEVEKRHEGKQD
ncbi:hypothetical protein STEG23_036658 [Scotinomys teguina]